MLNAALTILRKDAKLRMRDRSVLLFAFVVPLALTFVFSLLFAGGDDVQLRAGVVDLDGDDVAAGFTDGVLPALVDEGVIDTVAFGDEDEARRAIADGEVAAAWIVPAGFTASVVSGAGGEIHVLFDPDRGIAGAVANGIAQGFVSEVERAVLAVAVTGAAVGAELDPAEIQEVIERSIAVGGLVTIDELVAADRQLAPTSYLAAGMAVFFLFFTVTFGITGHLEERQQGTLPRLLASPIGVGSIHLGKALGAYLLGLVSMTVLAVASAVALDAPWGPPLGVALLVVAAVFAAIGVMALVGSFAKTAEQVGNLQSIVALVLGLAGGVFFPVGGGLLGSLTLISPHGWFLRGLGDLAGTGAWTSVLPAAGALMAFGAVTAVPGLLRMHREVA